LAVRPHNARTWRDIGDRLTELARLEEAVDAYRQAVACKSDYAIARGRLAAALEKVGRFAEAVPHWDRAIELTRGPARSTLALSRALGLARVDPARAVAAAEQLIQEENRTSAGPAAALDLVAEAKRLIQGDLPRAERLY